MTHPRTTRDPLAREFLLGFWKIHILYHAAEPEGVYGQWMLEELQHHGYRLSPGTLYPILARMARRGWLKAVEPKRATDPRIYRITPAGRDVLDRLRGALSELGQEVGSRDHQTERTKGNPSSRMESQKHVHKSRAPQRRRHPRT
ncbi:MAG: PadR family transcriptional regulator [Vicinamibacterales bacterium]